MIKRSSRAAVPTIAECVAQRVRKGLPYTCLVHRTEHDSTGFPLCGFIEHANPNHVCIGSVFEAGINKLPSTLPHRFYLSFKAMDEDWRVD